MTSEITGIDLSKEAEYIKDMLAEHPEYVDDFVSGKERDGMNPRLHVFVEAIIQIQIAENDPPEARKAHLALMAGQSMNAHEARHALGKAFMEVIWHATKENWSADQCSAEYGRRLAELVKESKTT